jgi:peptidyl-prolyl cis-trans isomerase SurA
MKLREAVLAFAVGVTGLSATAAAQQQLQASAAKPPTTQKGPPAAKPEAAKPEATSTEGVAAVVNDEVISTFDVNQRSALILLTAGIQPSAEAMEQVRAQALRSLVDEHLEVQEAKDKKIKAEPKEIDQALDEIARSNRTTADQLKRQLASAGIGIATLRSQLEAEIAWRRLVGARYGSRVRISPGQIQDTLARIAANATKPQYLVSLIWLPADTPSEMQDASAAANKLMEEIQKGASFPLVARQFSGAPSAAAGGDLGWLSKGELKPEQLQAAVDTMEPGQIRGPVSAPGGVYILALRDKRAGVDPKTATKVTLQQISAPVNQRAALDRARRKIRGCETIQAAIAGTTGLEVVDLGQVDESQLNDQVRRDVQDTAVGAASALFEADGKVRSIAVCARDTAGGLLPSRDQVEDRLYEDEMAMLSQRYLRNLRRESTILTR